MTVLSAGDPTDEALSKAIAILAEHFINYAVVVQYDDGSVWHQSNNDLVEKALYEESLTQMKEEREWENSDVEIEWDDDEGESWQEVDTEE